MNIRRHMLVIASTLLVGAQAFASPADDSTPPPPTWKGGGANVEEKLGTQVPLDASFTTQDGTKTTLGEVLRGELPTILTFNYSECPMLCSLQLNGLMNALPEVAKVGPSPGPDKRDATFIAGKQFRIVTISLEPTESLARANKMRDRFLEKLPDAQRASAKAGWTFLVANGDASQIKRVAEAVGFSYVYLPERAEYAHPAALIFLSTKGTVTRYVYGIEFEAQMMRESIFKAGIAEAATAVGFMNRCYHYDPSENDYSHAGMMALRLGAAGFLVLMAAIFGFYFIRKNIRGVSP
ncbi:MAG TPA: SCO family protein [Acidimicrobiia bacterium]|nr:SCO family protein [Acidimicrobiia bacterium]